MLYEKLECGLDPVTCIHLFSLKLMTICIFKIKKVCMLVGIHLHWNTDIYTQLVFLG